jgi:hypothetical protein
MELRQDGLTPIQVNAQTCDSDTLPSFIKPIPSLKWLKFDGRYFIEEVDVQDAILSDENYFYSLNNVTIEQLLSLNNYFLSLDSVELTVPKTIFIFKVENEQIGYVSADQEKIYTQINEYIDEVVANTLTYIENDYQSVFFSQSPINKRIYFAYSDLFDMSAFAGCYVSATTQPSQFNYQNLVPEDATPFYPLESGYLYSVEIKASAFSPVLQSFSVYVRSSFLAPSFLIDQTNLLTISNNELSFTKKVTLSISLSVPEALISIRDQNDFSDEGKFYSYSRVTDIQSSPLMIEIPENQRIRLSIFYFDFINSSSFIKKSFTIYSTNRDNDSVNEIYELPSLNLSDPLINQTIYANSLFDYYLDETQRHFTLFVNQQPNGQIKNGGIVFKSLVIRRNTQVLEKDDENNPITLNNNDYQFFLSGNYSITFRYNNRSIREITKAFIFASINPTVTFRYSSNDTISGEQETRSKTLFPSTPNYINSTNVSIRFNHISETNTTRIPIHLTILNRQNQEVFIPFAIERDVSLQAMIQGLSDDLLVFNNESFFIEVYDWNNQSTITYPLLINTRFEGLQLSTTFDDTLPIEEQAMNLCDFIDLVDKVKLACSSEALTTDQTILDYSENHYFYTSNKTASIQMQYVLSHQANPMTTKYFQEDAYLVANNEFWIYQFALPSGTEFVNILSIHYVVRDIYENEFQFSLRVRPLGRPMSVFPDHAISLGFVILPFASLIILFFKSSFMIKLLKK